MELDKRIIDRKYIFDCFNADKAKEFIGEDCFMTNDIELFKNLDSINVYKLDKIEDGFYNEEENEYFDFFAYQFDFRNQKKNRNSLDHIPLWNFLTYSQLGGRLNSEEKEK